MNDNYFYNVIVESVSIIDIIPKFAIAAKINPIIIPGIEYNKDYVINTPIIPILLRPTILRIPNSNVRVSTDIINNE
jgi:hypothetical protein